FFSPAPSHAWDTFSSSFTNIDYRARPPGLNRHVPQQSPTVPPHRVAEFVRPGIWLPPVAVHDAKRTLFSFLCDLC
ncbi:MAG: hypothetical protein BJ554DRAFT_870, partial [Olpidium bornovanus]